MKNQSKKNNYKSYMYLAQKPCKAAELSAALPFVEADRVEVWTQVNLLELTTENGTVTFEDMMDNLRREDKALLEQMEVAQVYAFEYEQSDTAFVQKVMETLITEFGGRIGSDTENFEPFCEVRDM